MEMMTLTKEQRELKAMAPATAQAAGARVRELTPAQRRAVMFAQQQVLRARAAKKAKDERQAALTRMWQEEDSDRYARMLCRTLRNSPMRLRRFRCVKP